jgi:hypothetical protein
VVGYGRRALPSTMIALLVLLLLLLAPAAYLFLGVQPRTNRTVALRSFNIATLVLAFCSAVAVSMYSWRTTGQSVDRGWWPALAVLGSGFAVGIILIVGTIIRTIVFTRFRLRTLLIAITLVAILLGLIVYAAS